MTPKDFLRRHFEIYPQFFAARPGRIFLEIRRRFHSYAVNRGADFLRLTVENVVAAKKHNPGAPKRFRRGDLPLPQGDGLIPKGEESFPAGESDVPGRDGLCPERDRLFPHGDGVLTERDRLLPRWRPPRRPSLHHARCASAGAPAALRSLRRCRLVKESTPIGAYVPSLAAPGRFARLRRGPLCRARPQAAPCSEPGTLRLPEEETQDALLNRREERAGQAGGRETSVPIMGGSYLIWEREPVGMPTPGDHRGTRKGTAKGRGRAFQPTPPTGETPC